MKPNKKMTYQEKLDYFSTKRASCEGILRGETLEEALERGIRYFPKIGGRVFTSSNVNGHATPEEAKQNAREILADIKKRKKEKDENDYQSNC